jgi:hypothetical protein
MVPVQPVTIHFHYDNENNDPSWNHINLKNNDDVVPWYMWRFMSKPIDITVTLMEEAFPTDNMTPKEYSIDVRNKMLYDITGVKTL